MSSYLVLLRVGVYHAAYCYQKRGALLPHPFTLTGSCELRRSSLCCTGRRLTPPRCYLALCPKEPGLSSNKQACPRLFSRLTHKIKNLSAKRQVDSQLARKKMLAYRYKRTTSISQPTLRRLTRGSCNRAWQ